MEISEGAETDQTDPEIAAEMGLSGWMVLKSRRKAQREGWPGFPPDMVKKLYPSVARSSTYQQI